MSDPDIRYAVILAGITVTLWLWVMFEAIRGMVA